MSDNRDKYVLNSPRALRKKVRSTKNIENSWITLTSCGPSHNYFTRLFSVFRVFPFTPPHPPSMFIRLLSSVILSLFSVLSVYWIHIPLLDRQQEYWSDDDLIRFRIPLLCVSLWFLLIASVVAAIVWVWTFLSVVELRFLARVRSEYQSLPRKTEHSFSFVFVAVDIRYGSIV